MRIIVNYYPTHAENTACARVLTAKLFLTNYHLALIKSVGQNYCFKFAFQSKMEAKLLGVKLLGRRSVQVSPIQWHKQRGSSCLVYVFREKLFGAPHSLMCVFAVCMH